MIRLNDLTIGYGHRILLQHASATIPAGELVALVGRNGTGKSTLLRAIAGFGERLGGEIRLDGHSLETLSPQQLATTVSFVTTERVRIPNLRCEDVVALGRAPTPTGSDAYRNRTKPSWNARWNWSAWQLSPEKRWTACPTANASG